MVTGSDVASALPVRGTTALRDALQVTRDAVEACITGALSGSDLDVARAMEYASVGGKGLRGFLVTEGATLYDVGLDHSTNIAAAIECVHAYSLVHDDMPCMDDDDLRRGLPTVHRKWDDATAVLAGDALQALAFELVADSTCSDTAKVDLTLSLARAAGVAGMVGGQAMDIAAESADSPLSLEHITALQAGKTGALITWSACAGARIAQENTADLQSYGDALGLAFQIADDLLDIEGDAVEMGKAAQKDADRGKATFVSHLGVDGAKRRAQDLVDQAKDALSTYGDRANTLRDAADFVISRRK